MKELQRQGVAADNDDDPKFIAAKESMEEGEMVFTRLTDLDDSAESGCGALLQR